MDERAAAFIQIAMLDKEYQASVVAATKCPICSQCGQCWGAIACGPTHAIVKTLKKQIESAKLGKVVKGKTRCLKMKSKLLSSMH